MRCDGDFPHQGYMDEVRISKGIARWTSNFTPPTGAYFRLPQVYVGGWHTATSVSVSIGGVWKNVAGIKVWVTDAWKDLV
jgi:hypothetical protein